MDSKSKKRPLLLLSDSFSSRLFLGSGIVGRLNKELKGELDVIATFDLMAAKEVYDFDYTKWTDDDRVAICMESDLFSRRRCTFAERVRLALDAFVDRHAGYYPLTMHFNLKHGFMRPRMAWKHRNVYLDLSQGFLIPRNEFFFRKMFQWQFGAKRYFHPAIKEFMAANTSCLLAANVQFKSAQPYVVTAHRLGLPIAGNIASWDHPVGKGVVFPGCDTYVVQNEYMKEVLVAYHGIDGRRVVITGWPQTDLFVRRTSREHYRALLESFGLDPSRPCVLVAGNSASNAPYEPEFLKRLVERWVNDGKSAEYSIVFRPHPKDSQWKQRFSDVPKPDGFYMQSASFSDIDVMTTLLQHVDCVVTNAGTILLDSLVNDRPVVCVLYDEGAPAGSSEAIKNITGHHYQELMASGSFYMADSMGTTIECIAKGLSNPAELRDERSRICRRIIGQVDGEASRRIANAMLSVNTNNFNGDIS